MTVIRLLYSTGRMLSHCAAPSCFVERTHQRPASLSGRGISKRRDCGLVVAKSPLANDVRDIARTWPHGPAMA